MKTKERNTEAEEETIKRKGEKGNPYKIVWKPKKTIQTVKTNQKGEKTKKTKGNKKQEQT